MRRLLQLLTFLLLLPAASFAQTATVTGHVLYPSNGAPTNASACFTLLGYKPNLPRVVGIGTIIQQTNFCVSASSVDGSFSTTLFQNPSISPATTSWRVDLLWNGQQQSSATFNVNTSPFNLDTATPLAVVPTASSGTIVTSAYVCATPIAATTWVCTHNLNDSLPVVEIWNPAGVLLDPTGANTYTVTATNANTITIVFNSAQAGNARIVSTAPLNIATNQPDAIVSHPVSPQTIHGQPLSIDTLTPGNCVQAGTGGLLTTIASGCATASTMDTIPNGILFAKHAFIEGPLLAVYNGDFEGDFPGPPPLPPPDWLPNPNMTCTYETVTPYEGLRSLKCVANTAGSGAAVSTYAFFPVTPGETFYISGAAKTDGVVTANIVLRFLDKNFLASAFPGDAIIASTTSTSWTLVSATGVAPSNAAFVFTELVSSPLGTAGTTWYDFISAYRVSYPGPISAPTLTATGLTPGNCVQAGTGGLLTTTGTGCALGGSVTSVSDGGFAPLFTTNVANPTTTPAITNTAINQYANTFLAGPSGTATDVVDFAVVNATGTASPMSITATPKQSGDIAMVFTVQDSNNDGSFAPDVSWTASTLNTSLQKYYYKVVSGLATATASGTIGSAHPNWAATEALFTAKPTFTPAVTNQANINSGACNFTNQAIGFTPTAGRTLIVAVMSGYTSFFGGPVNVTSLTDSVGDVFAPLSQITNSTGRGTEITLLAAYNIVGGATTFSCSQSGGMSNGTVDLFEVSNIAPINPLVAPMTVRRIVATDLPPTVTFTNKNLAGNVTVNANTLTLIDSMTVHFPSSGGPWRAFLAYDYYFNGGVNGECYLTDGTTLQMLVESQPLNNSSSCQMGALSKATYADGSVVTFSVYTYDTGATTVNASGGRNVTVILKWTLSSVTPPLSAACRSWNQK